MISIQEKAFSRKIFKKRFDSLLDFYKGQERKREEKQKKSDWLTANMLHLEQNFLAIKGKYSDASHILIKHNMGSYSTKNQRN